MKNQGRNEKCNCGSGKKYKNCCMRKEIRVFSSIGFYYKSKEDNGFCMSVDRMSNPELFDFFFKGYNSIKQEWKKQISDMKSGRYYESFEELLKITIEFEKGSLNEEISNWYKLNGFPNGLQPYGTDIINWEISPRTIPTLSNILRSIYILTEVGVIKNDNYNGLILM